MIKLIVKAKMGLAVDLSAMYIGDQPGTTELGSCWRCRWHRVQMRAAAPMNGRLDVEMVNIRASAPNAERILASDLL